MLSVKSSLATVAGLIAAAAAAPTVNPYGLDGIIPKPASNATAHHFSQAAFDCTNLAFGLTADDCNWMANIGMAGQGANAQANNGNIWLGTDGANTFTYTNNAGAPLTVIVWYNAPGDYTSSFMNARTPMVSYSLVNNGDQVTVSVANGVSGGWSALYNHATTLSQYGQIFNTWGEFTTGQYATVDVSREVNMGGNAMSVVTSGGCHSDMSTCVFTCLNGNTCGESGTYALTNCDNGSQPGATYGVYDGNPSGGCQAWANGGHLDISLNP